MRFNKNSEQQLYSLKNGSNLAKTESEISEMFNNFFKSIEQTSIKKQNECKHFVDNRFLRLNENKIITSINF